jgi:integrase
VRANGLLVFPNPRNTSESRDVSRVGKLVRRLFNGIEGDGECPMTWASSHTFRRTLVTGMHMDSVPDALIADATGHDDLRICRSTTWLGCGCRLSRRIA